MEQYVERPEKAFAGLLYGIGPKIVDSFAVEDAKGIDAGVAVIRGTDTERQVKAASTSGDGAKVIGVTLHTHVEQPATGNYYPAEDVIPVVTKGRIWVKTGDAVKAGDAANVKLADGTFVSTEVSAGTIEALGCGAKFITSCDKAGLAVVEIG